ncbi:MAG: sigma 54-interacting transcriptional regulator [Acidobacteriota bacterium]|nr:sigma 54-interacting transcriptional regulator [Acidobacteriota bacterium]
MKVHLISHEYKQLETLRDSLSQNGLEVTLVATPWETQDWGTSRLVILVTPSEDAETLWRVVEHAGKKMGASQDLMVCCPSLFDNDEFLTLGASKIITPDNWGAAAVAERILGEVFLMLPKEQSRLGSILGATRTMRNLYAIIKKVASLREPVLILGEMGTGKGMFADEIHRLSNRSEKLFLVNCAEFKPELLESELFGHKDKSFTGAVKRQGLLVSAGEGTVFLDEIGELETHAQAKLLNVVEKNQVRPMGDNNFYPVRARMIFATNRNLHEEIHEGKFRSDLYHRLSYYVLDLPPLREHKADILLLADHFVDQYNQQYGKNLALPEQGLDMLFQYDWPGNIRELRRAIYRAAGFTDHQKYIDIQQLQQAVSGNAQRRAARHAFEFDPIAQPWQKAHDHFRKAYFRKLLAEASSKKEAIEISGMSRARFYEILKATGLNEEDGKDE